MLFLLSLPKELSTLLQAHMDPNSVNFKCLIHKWFMACQFIPSQEFCKDQISTKVMLKITLFPLLMFKNTRESVPFYMNSMLIHYHRFIKSFITIWMSCQDCIFYCFEKDKFKFYFHVFRGDYWDRNICFILKLCVGLIRLNIDCPLLWLQHS